MEFRPCIDIHNGRVKQIVGATLIDGEAPSVNFESKEKPSYYSNLYKKDNLTGGHIIKLGPGNDEAAYEALGGWPRGMQLGGGITPDNAKEFLDAGASHIIVTSYVFNNGIIDFDKLDKLVATVGKERIVLDLSCKERDGEYYIVTDRWQKWTDVRVNRDSLELFAKYCDEILVHAASVEGKMEGPDLKLVKILADYSPVPTTYAGGIATLEDIKAVKVAGCNKVNITIGSALDIFGGKLPYRDVVNFCRDN